MTGRNLDHLDDAEIRLRYLMGQTERQLAASFGVPRPAIQRSLSRTGTERRPPGLERRDDVDTAKVVELRNSGLTWQQVADAVGMTTGGVRRRYDEAFHRYVDYGEDDDRAAAMGLPSRTTGTLGVSDDRE